MPRLIVTHGVDRGKQFDLTTPVVAVGRHSTNAVALHDTQVSRRHLELRQTPAGGYEAVDLGSGNGTLVNGRPAGTVALRSGDTVTIGQTQFVYAADGGGPGGDDLTERVKLFPGGTATDLAASVVRTVPADAGSQILARPDRATTDWLRVKLAHLAALYETADAVSHILDLDQLLDRVMDLVFRSVGADRGCFMVRGRDGTLTPKAVRYRDGVSRREELAVSRTIVDHVLSGGEGVLVADAQADGRFRGGASILRHDIREAVCVPLRGRREVVGVLFLDTRTAVPAALARGGTSTFTEDHLTLASAIAHQAAIAVEEARYHQALVEAERLAAVGQTIAAMSHHIKNIMQGVRFGADMVRTALRADDRDLLGKGWRLVEKNQTRIDALILDMLSFSKEREPLAEPTDLNALCDDVLDLVRGRAAEAGVALDWRPGAGVGAVPCDGDGIHRAVLNVVGNAVDATAGRPSATVSVQALLEAGGDWARIVVVDNGPGIPADAVDDVFKPFVSTKGSRGTGLGLPVSRKILREHGGDVTVESVEGKGSTFVLRLPMKSAFAADAGTAALRPPDE